MEIYVDGDGDERDEDITDVLVIDYWRSGKVGLNDSLFSLPVVFPTYFSTQNYI